MSKEPELKTLLVDMKNGARRRYVVPAEAKVTMGPLVPGSRYVDQREDNGGLAIRIYMGKDRQIAVIRGAAGFYEQGLVSVAEQKSERRERIMADGKPGSAKTYTATVERRYWSAPDEDVMDEPPGEDDFDGIDPLQIEEFPG